MPPLTVCVYCGTDLVPYAHWALCPMCEPEYLAKVTPPSIAAAVQRQVGDLLLDKGRPTRDGRKV